MRKFNKDLQGKPVNFNRDNPTVNLRSSPAVRPDNLVATARKWFLALGKIGTATGTIETVPGKNYFWLQLTPSTELNAWFAVTFNFNAPKTLWVRSDVVHWQRAKTIVKRATEKAVQPVKEVVETTTEAAGDIVGTILQNLWKPAAIVAAVYLGGKYLESKKTKTA